MINNFLSMKIHELTIRHLSFQSQSVLDFTLAYLIVVAPTQNILGWFSLLHAVIRTPLIFKKKFCEINIQDFSNLKLTFYYKLYKMNLNIHLCWLWTCMLYCCQHCAVIKKVIHNLLFFVSIWNIPYCTIIRAPYDFVFSLIFPHSHLFGTLLLLGTLE